MTTTYDDIDYSGSYGAEAAEQAAAALKRGGSNRWEYFSLDDGGSAIGRLLTDAYPDHEMLDAQQPPRWLPWITVDQHSMVPTKPKPSDWPEGAKYPATMSAVCRHDKAFKNKYGDCYVCDSMVKPNGKKYEPSPRQWALICMREEIVGTPEMVQAGQITQAEVGRVVGIRDKTREIKKVGPDGKQTDEIEVIKDIRAINLGYKNFFSILQGFAGRYGTVLDRDYHFTRKGASTDTIYQIVPLDPIQVGDGRKFDLRDPEFMARYLSPENDIDLRRIVAERAGDEFYNRFFVPGAPSSTPGQASGSSSPTPPPAPQTEPDEGRLAALRDRVKQGVGGDAQPASEAPPAPEPSAPAPETAAAPAAAGAMRNFE